MGEINIHTHNLGYPRIGEMRELKRAVEAYWNGKSSREELQAAAAELRQRNWHKQQDAGIGLVPSNDFSLYDQVLDLSCMVGNIPPRFGWKGGAVELDTSFLVARGERSRVATDTARDANQAPAFASEMTKWFDTNYHYIAPEFQQDTRFALSTRKPVEDFLEAKALGIQTKPVLLGPASYLTLGKVHDAQNPDFDRFELFRGLLPVYLEVLQQLAQAGAEWVQIDEPILSLDLQARQQEILADACEAFARQLPDLKILVANYFGPLGDNLELACKLPCTALHIDGVRGADEVETVARTLPAERTLSLGVVDGRNIWKNDYEASLVLIRKVQELRPDTPLLLAPSCSLLHCPITLQNETRMDGELKNWLAFADEKLVELCELAQLARAENAQTALEANRSAWDARRNSTRIHDPEVKERVAGIRPRHLKRHSPFAARQARQRERLGLPLFPTTTIGSFPQTQEVRTARAQWRKGELSAAKYQEFLEQQTRACVEFQQEIGIDMPVHGEFERNDMVEYFGEQLTGFTSTQHGWVQSYGSRGVKPPVIFGDISRPEPMTIAWSRYAKSLTDKPIKGMLTGPVTILQWSFVRDDQPREQTARQIALAIREEVTDLEAEGIAAIQIDEPAFREGLPLRRADWAAYLQWAVECFRLSSSAVTDETQIHTHMCYSEFNDIIEAIADLDADVITIETARSNMELLDAFAAFQYPAEIGPGVYDIHSPRVPDTGEMQRLMHKAQEVLPRENLWVNPDCGLKTRQWEEVKLALQNMVECARQLRQAADPS